MVLSKQMSDKDRSMKTQLLIRSSSDGDDKLSGEKVWKNNGFIKDVKLELNLEKVNMPENAIHQQNQYFLLTVKSGEIAMQNQKFILGQLIIAANQPKDITTYNRNENGVKLHCCIYDLTTGEFQGIRQQLAYIALRGDKNEIFFSYGSDKYNSQISSSYSKQQIPDVFISTAFKKHNEIINEKKENEDSTSLLFYLPSMADRKEEINQWKNNTSLTPTDFNISFIQSFSKQKVKFQSNLLNSFNEKERAPQVEMLYGLFRHMTHFSNQNLHTNVAHLNLKQKRNVSEVDWFPFFERME